MASQGFYVSFSHNFYYSIPVGTHDLRTLWSPLVSLNTHKGTKQLILFLFYLFFVAKIRWKVPPWKHTWWSERFGKFPKKKLNRHILRRKKTGLKSLRFVKDLGRFQAFFFWNAFMKGVLTLTPLPPRRTTGQTDT